jgi:tRNA 2-selenouridine synthase
MRQNTDDYRQLFLRDVPMIDTRAPVEFERGAFPTAVNLPLMSDDEREQVGICYKQNGQASAIELGHQLVGGALKQERIQAWREFADRHPDGYLYCFRGGLRSQTAQQWLRDAGVDYPLVLGGYKMMRRFLLEETDRCVKAAELVLIAGKTGSGKTRVVEALQRALDLEGLAHHRGSTFGHLLEPQPSQIDFENKLAIGLMRLLEGDKTQVALEDEGRLIGRLSLPESLREKMQAAPLMVVEETLASRVQVILEDYVIDLGQRYLLASGELEGKSRHLQQLLDAVGRIRKRLGGVLHDQIAQQMMDGFAAVDIASSHDLHRRWIENLLVDYYDPMYDYQMAKREGDVIARGSREQIIHLASEHTSG